VTVGHQEINSTEKSTLDCYGHATALDPTTVVRPLVASSDPLLIMDAKGQLWSFHRDTVKGFVVGHADAS
jgi:hypothetical protein